MELVLFDVSVGKTGEREQRIGGFDKGGETENALLPTVGNLPTHRPYASPQDWGIGIAEAIR
jgi:hypothetical protein